MNPLAITRPAAQPLRPNRPQAVGRPCLLLLLSLLTLLAAPVRLAAQADPFAGPWTGVGIKQCVIEVAGGQLSAKCLKSGEAYDLLKAAVTGPRSAKGTWVSMSGDTLMSDYDVEMTVTPDGREMAVTGTRIHSGLREVRFSLQRPWDWKGGARAATGPVATCTVQLGYELPLLVSDSRPVALRLVVGVADAYRSRVSIAQAAFSARSAAPGRFAVATDDADGFHFYVESQDELTRTAANGAKELAFDVANVSFGTRPSLSLPKSLIARCSVTLVEGNARWVEKLDVPIRISDLFTAATFRGRADGMPTLKGARLAKGVPVKGGPGDELVIPPDAGIQAKFLDGSAVVYFNRDDVKWTLTMGAGKFTSTDASRFLSNKYEINALVEQGLADGAESATDAASEKGLEILLRKVASHSAAGLVVQVSQFFGSRRLGGEKVAVRLRSRVGVSLGRNGRIVVRNFAGDPEILFPGKPALKIPVGFQTVVAHGGVARPPEPFPAGQPSLWSADGVLLPPAGEDARPEKKRPAGANQAFAGAWRGTWSNDLGENGADSLVLAEGSDGNLAGKWSGSIRVSGRRSGPRDMTLRGKTSNRSYRIGGTVKDGVLTLRYDVTRLDQGGTYTGESKLTRTRN